ncbi:hypothetical protein CEUSTIGMA_g13481.t1 [Chlamydomonas eustigma]|uniref:Uncharacterized protein n=1 Tax=Chlamydomonas eustigma TaxID=1157962 RepID=A0A250XSL7_9CHLO|nr:hypothetical protein CEUSTIGMA_g13481.t1 [Chlamydomonas eustigma]|eukprot:GAX86067.1 hypothetical protein CEUSTIGMA_g13481.t1 [Chlamydomonas eustigma]
MQVGWCLHNIGAPVLVWVEFSRQCPAKFKADAKASTWYRFEGHSWKKDANCTRLRKALAVELVGQIGLTVQSIITSDPDDTSSISSASQHQTPSAAKVLVDRLMKIVAKLKDKPYKDSLVVELMQFLLDEEFTSKLDSHKHLIGFEDGVWDLDLGLFRPGVPEDFISLSTGYSLTTKAQLPTVAVTEYWSQLHPNEDQRLYVCQMFARQLFGDKGSNLFHIHAGEAASAANGKSTFFEILQGVLGSYMVKVDVSHFLQKNRTEVGKPMPLFEDWKGARIMYCTEPNQDEHINSGVLKSLTGGEEIQYRLCNSNMIVKFRLQAKFHLMCNDAPKLEGEDQGVRRRIRKIDYVSSFVLDLLQVDPSKFKFMADEGNVNKMIQDLDFRRAFFLDLVALYRHDYKFKITEAIRAKTECYIQENNAVLQFVSSWIERAPKEDAHKVFFTLEQAKYRFRSQKYNIARISVLKSDLMRELRTVCIEQKWINGENRKNVILGYRLLDEIDNYDE